MKKIYLGLFTLLMLLTLNTFKINAAYDTGHPDFESITFVGNDQKLLLKDINETDLIKTMNQVKWKFFGWKYKTLISKADAKYTGKTIFSRFNNTDQEINFNYSANIKSTEETSVVTKGSLGGSISRKGKSMAGALEAEIRKEIGYVTSLSKSETTDFLVKIKPGRKVSLVVKGDAKVSNGAAKYYFLGICFKKGNWEIVDIKSEYYELCEEII